MWKLSFFLSTLSVCSSSFALYTGNPGSPGIPEEGLFLAKESWLRIKAGYEYDHVQNRKVAVISQRSIQVKKIRTVKLLSNFGVFTASINQRLDLYCELGKTGVEISHRLNPQGPEITYQSHSHFAWGGGARAIIAYWGDTQLGLAASYRAVHPDLHAVLVNQDSFLLQKTKMSSSEWQMSLGLYHRFPYFIPYIALQYADFQGKISDLPLELAFHKRNFCFRNQRSFGVVLGFGLTNQCGLQCNFEARFFTENAYTLSAEISF
jgi:hypothetical protein